MVVLSSEIYTRAALDKTASEFQKICAAVVEEAPGGFIVRFPQQADEVMVSEFLNYLLALSVQEWLA
jgi:hypothetical protein